MFCYQLYFNRQLGTIKKPKIVAVKDYLCGTSCKLHTWKIFVLSFSIACSIFFLPKFIFAKPKYPLALEPKRVKKLFIIQWGGEFIG